MNALGGLSGPPPPCTRSTGAGPGGHHPTLQIFGIVLNVASLASLGGAAADWRLVLALPLGWALGTVIVRRLNAGQARHVILGVAAVGEWWRWRGAGVV
ncbi:hypothetical protein NKH77_31870 [Streptomyces sp. M19]